MVLILFSFQRNSPLNVNYSTLVTQRRPKSNFHVSGLWVRTISNTRIRDFLRKSALPTYLRAVYWTHRHKSSRRRSQREISSKPTRFIGPFELYKICFFLWSICLTKSCHEALATHEHS